MSCRTRRRLNLCLGPVCISLLGLVVHVEYLFLSFVPIWGLTHSFSARGREERRMGGRLLLLDDEQKQHAITFERLERRERETSNGPLNLVSVIIFVFALVSACSLKGDCIASCVVLVGWALKDTQIQSG